MKICFNDMVYAFSYALDCVEHDLIGVTTHHSERVAYLSIQIGKYFSLSTEQLLDLAACAVLHDNALTEYIKNEYEIGTDLLNEKDKISVGEHCTIGEHNIKNLPFFGDIQGAILYHHECADGSGAFHKRTEETPLFARIIHLTDQVDAKFDLSIMMEDKYNKILTFLMEEKEKSFDKFCVDAFINQITEKILNSIEDEKIETLLRKELPMYEREYSGKELIEFSTVYANIIDYKSKFTKTHSIGIANKCCIMAKYYGYNEEKQSMLYFAGAVHDIGKLVVNRDILEKPDKLTKDEYKHIQNHAFYTYMILSKIKGLGEIVKWASFHHEKLNGKGYPFGKSAKELGKEERLLACLDIYQALTEKRPYKEGMTHEEAMVIINKMVSKGELDAEISEDINKVFSVKCA